MRPRTKIPAAQVGAIRRAMLAASNTSSCQRLQCLWLRAQQELLRVTESILTTLDQREVLEQIEAALRA